MDDQRTNPSTAHRSAAAGRILEEDGELDAKLKQVQKDLVQISKRLATLRESHWHHTQLRLNDEIHEAWDRRDMKSAYKLMRQLAGSKFDVKKRDWRLIRQALPTRKEWEALLKEEGCKGGMLAKTCTWHDMRQEHITVANEIPLPPKDMNQIQQAKQDVKKLEQYVIFCKKTQSCSSRLPASRTAGCSACTKLHTETHQIGSSLQIRPTTLPNPLP